MSSSNCCGKNNPSFCNSDSFQMSFHSSCRIPTNYADLIDLPTINGIKILGTLTFQDLGLTSIYYDSTENWNALDTLVPAEGSLYIYSDYRVVSGQNVPGIRIGDGTHLLSELPFLSGGSSGGGGSGGSADIDILIQQISSINSLLDADAEGSVLMNTGGSSAWVNPANDFEGDNSRPITAAAVYTQIGNINALLATI